MSIACTLPGIEYANEEDGQRQRNQKAKERERERDGDIIEFSNLPEGDAAFTIFPFQVLLRQFFIGAFQVVRCNH